MNEIFKGKKILITGGAGSVGHALIDEILKQDPKVIRVFDSSENGVFNLEQVHGNGKLRYLIGDIRDKTRLRRAMDNIEIVIHLAAMKHVLCCEYNAFEAVKTNVIGIQNAIDAAIDADVEKFIFSSSDKAANPANVMGTTKLLGEKLISSANFYKGNKRTIFASVRFGNVMGSSGSVLPIFKKQIDAQEPMTITDEKMTRFVLTMKDAVNLIMKSVKLAKGGEVFVSKMETITVGDLAEGMIEKFGNGKEVEKKTIGAKIGEKPYEEIMTENERETAIETEGLYIIPQKIPNGFDFPDTYKENERVTNAILKSSDGTHMGTEEIRKLLDEVL